MCSHGPPVKGSTPCHVLPTTAMPFHYMCGPKPPAVCDGGVQASSNHLILWIFVSAACTELGLKVCCHSAQAHPAEHLPERTLIAASRNLSPSAILGARALDKRARTISNLKPPPISPSCHQALQLAAPQSSNAVVHACLAKKPALVHRAPVHTAQTATCHSCDMPLCTPQTTATRIFHYQSLFKRVCIPRRRLPVASFAGRRCVPCRRPSTFPVSIRGTPGICRPQTVICMLATLQLAPAKHAHKLTCATNVCTLLVGGRSHALHPTSTTGLPAPTTCAGCQYRCQGRLDSVCVPRHQKCMCAVAAAQVQDSPVLLKPARGPECTGCALH
ncbi:MAG: hypothetical protein J3K34DRAFT_426953 [Monoraphidium minutum]|nr:MAG: hypothetical protein J3K34DRAFT_426953 [Monoraphidium minutum]